MKHSRLKIAICHFHLHTGGVTRVIQHALEALAKADLDIVVLTGEAPSEPLPQGVPFRVIRGLAYEEKREPVNGVDLATEMRAAVRELLGADPDVWHIHNPSLGKNLAAPAACRSLAEKGHHLLLHLHDFAEDGRPALYRRMLNDAGGSVDQLATDLYPVAEQVHYAVLNGRDRRQLLLAGIPETRLHLLPNAVWLSRTQVDRSEPLPYDAARRLWLYPTRAIRRKNLGELLLWSTLAEDGDLFGATQAPLNPAERPVYDSWKQLAEELKLPLAFELGVDFRGDFLHLLQSSHALVSTSITEGFGLAFLEPWVAGCPLAGRDLPEITADFSAFGISLGALYPRLPIPLEWLDRVQLKGRIDAGLKRSMQAYGRNPDDMDFERAWNAFVIDDTVDFGRLDEPLQASVIRRLVDDRSAAGELSMDRLPLGDNRQLIDKNRRAIDAHLSLEQYGERLQALYGQVVESATSNVGSASGNSLLDAFLAPERLYLLKT